MSNFDQQCNRIRQLADNLNYKAVSIDYDPPKMSRKSRGYTVSAEVPYQGRVVLAADTSWAKCYAAAIKYMQ